MLNNNPMMNALFGSATSFIHERIKRVIPGLLWIACVGILLSFVASSVAELAPGPHPLLAGRNLDGSTDDDGFSEGGFSEGGLSEGVFSEGGFSEGADDFAPYQKGPKYLMALNIMKTAMRAMV